MKLIPVGNLIKLLCNDTGRKSLTMPMSDYPDVFSPIDKTEIIRLYTNRRRSAVFYGLRFRLRGKYNLYQILKVVSRRASSKYEDFKMSSTTSWRGRVQFEHRFNRHSSTTPHRKFFRLNQRTMHSFICAGCIS